MKVNIKFILLKKVRIYSGYILTKKDFFVIINV